jgi:anoctamin-7
VSKEEPEELFTRQQRSYIVYEMLQSLKYGDEHRGEVGLQRLLQEGAFRAAFPLHDVGK